MVITNGDMYKAKLSNKIFYGQFRATIKNFNVLAQSSIRKLVLVPYWLVMENMEKVFCIHISQFLFIFLLSYGEFL